MTLAHLSPGRSFTLAYNGRTGTLLHLSECGALVRYHGIKRTTFTDHRTGRTVSFTKAASPALLVSAGTEVVS